MADNTEYESDIRVRFRLRMIVPKDADKRNEHTSGFFGFLQDAVRDALREQKTVDPALIDGDHEKDNRGLSIIGATKATPVCESDKNEPTHEIDAWFEVKNMQLSRDQEQSLVNAFERLAERGQKQGIGQDGMIAIDPDHCHGQRVINVPKTSANQRQRAQPDFQSG